MKGLAVTANGSQIPLAGMGKSQGTESVLGLREHVANIG
jgi:hypothetical protein